MKKTIIILSALLTLAACNTEIIEIETDTNIDASKVVFNINVNKSDGLATKGVKTDWVDGDVVYVFFQGGSSSENTSQYVRMSFNGSSWTYSDKDKTTVYNGLKLYASGKKLSAVYMPDFVIGSAYPENYGNWGIGSEIGGFILTAEEVPYTVTDVNNVMTLEATIEMTAPDNLVQVYVPNAGDLGDGNEFVLNMTNVKPFTFRSIANGGKAYFNVGTVNFPLTGYYGTMGGQTGYYFWGILANPTAGSINYNFQLVEQKIKVVIESGYETVYKYAISSKSKTVNGKTLTGPTAIKLQNLTNNGNFVSLGYSDGPLWATGNLDKTTDSKIADPLLAGQYFKYGNIDPYSTSQANYTGTENPLSTSKDAAYQTNSSWRIPTQAQFEALLSNSTKKWKKKWTSIGNDKGGELITSNLNGISLFFAAAGFVESDHGSGGHYWSSTPFDNSSAWPLDFDSYGIYVTDNSKDRDRGMSIRPVKN